jgi:glutathione synthase/RimK-type ligase-like ATP-grasp enzyme
VIHLLGIYREKEYSPGRHQSNDVLLLERVADRLRERDLVIDLATLDQVRRSDPASRRNVRLILSMCQGRAALDMLAGWERDGARIVNSPHAALNTYRDRLPELMTRAGVAYPPTLLVSTDPLLQTPADLEIDGGVWLKRGDVHASVSADVQRVDSLVALNAGRAEFASRGIRVAAVQTHRTGDEIKFYGVAGELFFWFYPGPSRGYAFDHSALPSLAVCAAAAAGLEIFGGDVIVSSEGELTLIDLNDWPSFAPCRDAAAVAIADYLTRRVNAPAWNPGLVSSANESAV